MLCLKQCIPHFFCCYLIKFGLYTSGSEEYTYLSIPNWLITVYKKDCHFDFRLDSMALSAFIIIDAFHLFFLCVFHAEDQEMEFLEIFSDKIRPEENLLTIDQKL